MKPHDIFGLAVRIVGLVSLVYLLSSAVFLFGSGLPWRIVLTYIAWLVFSLWLIRGAPQLVRFAYPDAE